MGEGRRETWHGTNHVRSMAAMQCKDAKATPSASEPAQRAARELLAGIADLYLASPLTAAVGAVVDHADPVTLLRCAPRLVPAIRHIRPAVTCGVDEPCARIAASFAVIAEAQAWQQNPNYVSEPPSATFLDNYGYVEFVGPGRAIQNSSVRVGLLLLGPGLLYPPHVHPAEEVYHVVSGLARWWQQGADWRHQPVGTAIHHLPNVPHSTACDEEPLLALYCWFGEIEASARLCRQGSPELKSFS